MCLIIKNILRTAEKGIILFLIFLLSSSLISCSDKEADHQRFVDAYVDLRIVQDTLKNDSTDIRQIKAEILKKHGLTEEGYESAFEYFNNNPELWEKFYDEAIARVDSLKDQKK
jgi:tRNA/tmRNA/rRNA uracil-C5-methylase (TrmA/RlmC/RlmD family)